MTVMMIIIMIVVVIIMIRIRIIEEPFEMSNKNTNREDRQCVSDGFDTNKLSLKLCPYKLFGVRLDLYTTSSNGKM